MSREEEKTAPNDADEAEAKPDVARTMPRQYRRNRGKALRYLVIAAVALVAIAFAAREVVLRMTHVYEYDARIVTDQVTIGSQVEGNLLAVNVEAGDRVNAGDLLAQVDDTVERLELAALQAELAGIRAQRGEFAARSSMVTKQTDSRYRTRVTGVRAQQARRSALAAELRLARQELSRFRNLFERRVIARSRLDRAESEVSRLLNAVREADAQIASSREEAAEAEADKGELTVIEQEVAMLDFKESELRAMVARHQALIERRAIRAPISGIIDRVFVESGEYVGEGRRILMMHDPSDVWVEANIKETQIRRLRRGQRVDVAVDAYPDDEFVGRVEMIGSAATSRFALLPTPNPSGNFTKVTQRLPVKIVLDQQPRKLAPGMMVEIDVNVADAE